jgi:hypothetical protein
MRSETNNGEARLVSAGQPYGFQPFNSSAGSSAIQIEAEPTPPLMIPRGEVPDNGGAKQPELPAVGENVVAHCDGFRCLAYLDPESKWRSVFSKQALPGVKSWSSLKA